MLGRALWRPMITSRHNPIVARYRAAARGEDRTVMLLDGVHLVRDAIAAGVALHDVAVTSAAMARGEIATLVRSLEANGVAATGVSEAVMSALSPVRSTSPIVALAARTAVPVSRVFCPPGAVPLVLVAVDVQDPGNLGAMVRVAEAAGASGVVAAGACADPFGWKALRGSMGGAR